MTHLRKDLLASVVVFLVALPLCMGIAIASGVPPAAGLISGIVGGIVVGALAGAPLQVTGPAAGLAVMVLDIVTRQGLEALAPIVFGAALLQLAAGFLRQGRVFRAVSPAVIQGMLAGIGVLILLSQLYVLIDLRPGRGLANLTGLGAAAKTLINGPVVHRHAGLIGLATILVIVAWQYLPKKARTIPAPLVGAVVGSVLANLLALEIPHVTVPTQLLAELRPLSFDSIQLLGERGPLLACFALAAIASAETLLCTTATDQLHDGPRANYDRELIAQGAGNLICGVVGALPVSGVIVRSSANIEAGAKTRLSAVLHGVWILMFVVLLPSVLGLVPVSCLAGVLVFTGVKLAHPKNAKVLFTYGRGELFIYGATLVSIVAIDLLTGILIGMGLAFLRLIRAAARLQIKSERLSSGEHCVRLVGAATFVSLPKIAHTLEAIPRDVPVHVHTERLTYIDSACLDLLQSFERRHAERGTHVYVQDWPRLWETYHGEPGTPAAECPGLDRPESPPAQVPAQGE